MNEVASPTMEVGIGVTFVAMIAGLLLLVFLLGLLTIVVVALWKKKWAVAAVVGLLLFAPFLVMPFVLYSSRAVSKRRKRSPVDQSFIPTVKPPSQAEQPGGERRSSAATANPIPTDTAFIPGDFQGTGSFNKRWADIEDVPFDANVYPSIASAAKPLAVRFKEKLTEALQTQSSASESNKVKRIWVTAEEIPPQYRASVLGQFMAQLSSEYEDVDLQTFLRSQPTEDNGPEPQPGEITVSLSLKDEHNIPVVWEGTSQSQASGVLAATVDPDALNSGMKLYLLVQRNYVEAKEWLLDFEKFLRERPGKKLLLGYSQDFTSGKSASRLAAIKDAQNQLHALAGDRRAVVWGEHLVVEEFSQRLIRRMLLRFP